MFSNGKKEVSNIVNVLNDKVMTSKAFGVVVKCVFIGMREALVCSCIKLFCDKQFQKL